MGKKNALAILPAGTMNLFARGLGIPQSLDAAVESFATGKIKAIDLASDDGRPFVHQFSIGMHAKMVGMREKMEFTSRFGKIRASIRTGFATALSPPSLKVALTIGDAEIVTRATGIGITNNGERAPPLCRPA
jgi:diacylglycerol kinase family enzyme